MEADCLKLVRLFCVFFKMKNSYFLFYRGQPRPKSGFKQIAWAWPTSNMGGPSPPIYPFGPGLHGLARFLPSFLYVSPLPHLPLSASLSHLQSLAFPLSPIISPQSSLPLFPYNIYHFPLKSLSPSISPPLPL